MRFCPCRVGLSSLLNFSSYFLQKGDVSPPQDPVATLQYLLGPLPKLTVSGHPLGVELMNINAYLRPSLMYGYWEGWDGTPLLQPPLFYHGLTESTAQLICSISEEIVNLPSYSSQRQERTCPG